MGWTILNNILWILFAYLIGSINFSIILTKFVKKQNIKELGSKNAGATNAARLYGFRFGLIIFLLDASKSYWLGFTLGILQTHYEEFNNLIPQLILLFAIVGHIFPIYFKFKGGKGAATLLGMIASISLFLAMIGAVLFIAIVRYTKYVSLGSITVPYVLSILAFLCPYFNNIDSTIAYGYIWLNPLFLFLGSVIVASSHWQNIIRLLSNTESKTSFSKKTKIKNQNSIVKNEDEKSNQENNSNLEHSNQNNTSLIDEATSLNNNFKKH